MPKKKKAARSVSGLDAKQVAFIYAKVQALGSVGEVKRFYRRGDAVAKFAVECALMMFNVK